WRIPADGKTLSAIDVSNVAGHERDTVQSFVIGADDRVYVITTFREKMRVLEFDASGKFASAIEVEGLDENVLVMTPLAVFNSDAMLVTAETGGKHVITTGVYSRGRITPLSNTKDDGPQQNNPEGKATDYAAAVAATDGNVYLIKPGLKGPALGIAPTGQVV